MTVEVASSEQVFGLQASRPPRVTFLASAFTGHPIGFAAPRSQTQRQHMEVCSLLPQRDCCRISRHSLFLRRNAFKELVGRVPSLGRPSIKEEKLGRSSEVAKCDGCGAVGGTCTEPMRKTIRPELVFIPSRTFPGLLNF
jgi:hypothetical protein